MRKWKDNIKMGLREMWFGGVGWIYVAQDRVQNGGSEYVNEASGFI
jgi:hypothetical protein